MGFIKVMVIPVAVLSVILIACKMLNFSILPEGLKLPSPKKFKFPKVQRNGYKWEAWEEDSDDDSDSEDDWSDSDSEDEWSDDDDEWEF